MATESAVKCNMCETREMVAAPIKDGGFSALKICPNCDSPSGTTPTPFRQ